MLPNRNSRWQFYWHMQAKWCGALPRQGVNAPTFQCPIEVSNTVTYLLHQPYSLSLSGSTARGECQLIRCTCRGANNSDLPVGVCQSPETQADVLIKPRSAAPSKCGTMGGQWNVLFREVKPIVMDSHQERATRHGLHSVQHRTTLKAGLYYFNI